MPRQLDDYRLLGRSGLRVSPLCLGTMTFGVGPGTWGSSDEEAQAMVDSYIGKGGNFIDTANFYGQMGQSEVVLGKLLKGRRDPIVISTKYSLTTRPGDPNAAGNQRKNMVRSYERWYYAMPQRVRRSFERASYYLENPAFLKKRLGRALGVVAAPKRHSVTRHH